MFSKPQKHNFFIYIPDISFHTSITSLSRSPNSNLRLFLKFLMCPNALPLKDHIISVCVCVYKAVCNRLSALKSLEYLIQPQLLTLFPCMNYASHMWSGRTIVNLLFKVEHTAFCLFNSPALTNLPQSLSGQF